MKLGDRVIYRNPSALGEILMCKITEVNLTATVPYTVTALNPPYKGQTFRCTDFNLTASKHLFAKAVIVGKHTGQYFHHAADFCNSRVENMPASLNKKADLVIFTGGEDVSPFMYGEKPHKTTHMNPARDSDEALIYKTAKRLGIPCVGICRGAQFLNVMNKGRLVQHVTNHTSEHKISTTCGHTFDVTSTHHQMMDPHETAEILGWSDKLSDNYEGLTDFVPCTNDNKVIEPEVVLYRHTRDLCVQYHPETMEAGVPARVYFQEILKELL